MNFLSIGEKLHSNQYRPDIDGIRAIAVTSVVLCHAYPDYIKGGFIGVDIFFVISGYLITNIILKDMDNNRFSIWSFYDRRIRRIFPALLTVLAFTLALGSYCLFGPEFSALGTHISASSLFSENLLLWSEVSYFDTSSTVKPTLHLWSLAVEEQFYILWPIVLYVTHRWRVNYFVVISGLAVLSFGMNLHDLKTDPTAAYYSPLGRSWELMAGSLLSYIQYKKPSALDKFQNSQSIIGLLLIAIGLVFIRPETPFPGTWALFPVAGAFLLISSGGNTWAGQKILASAPMVLCGLISYPLYLWHWVFIGYSNIIFTATSVRNATLCIGAAIVMSVLTFHYIERPLRSRGEGLSRPLGLLACLLAISGLGFLATNQIIVPRLHNIYAPSQNEWSFLKKLTGNTGGNVADKYKIGGSREASVLFIGDSHVAQYASRLDTILKRDLNRPGALLAIDGGCIPIDGVKSDNPQRVTCWLLRDEAHHLAKEPQYKRIVIGGAWNFYFLTEGYYFLRGNQRLSLTTEQGQKAALDHLAESIRLWQKDGKQVTFILDNPISRDLSSTDWRIRFKPGMVGYPANQVVKVPDAQSDIRQRLSQWASSLGIELIDPFSSLCEGSMCQKTDKDGMTIYRDNGHFNPDWSIDHATFIDKAVDKIKPAN